MQSTKFHTNITTKLISHLLFFILFLSEFLTAEELPQTKLKNFYDFEYGIFGAYDLNLNDVNFHGLPNVPSCCPNYSFGVGNFLEFGALLDFKIANYEDFPIELKINYGNIGGNFVAQENIVMDNGANGYVDGIVEHKIDSKISYLNIEPSLNYKFMQNFLFNLSFSGKILLNSHYDQKETLLQPSYLTFNNGLRTRFVYSGAIDSLSSFYPSIGLGVRYDWKKSEHQEWFLSPEFQFSIPLTSYLPVDKWKAYNIRLGLSLRYNYDKTKPQPIFVPEIKEEPVIAKKIEYKTRIVENIDTLVYDQIDLIESKYIQGIDIVNISQNDLDSTITRTISRTDTLYKPVDYNLVANLEISAIDKTGFETNIPIIKIEEFLASKMHPLLNYVFFDENSDSIPDRYSLLNENETTGFNTKMLFNKGTLEVYHQILNIIGQRLVQKPDSKITLVGCNSNTDNEKNNLKLSRNRAEAIKDYFMNTWKIKSNRIKILARNLPSSPSNSEFTGGIAENRRVEINSDDLDVISPVVTNDTVSTIDFYNKVNDSLVHFDLAGLRFKTNHSPNVKLNYWNLSLNHKDSNLINLTNSNNLEPVYDFVLQNDDELIKLLSKPLQCKFEIKDFKNNEANASQTIVAEKTTVMHKKEKREGDKKIDTYSLVLFDYGSPDLTPEQKNIPQFVRTQIASNSKVTVIGYSDELGEERINKILSLQRSREVSDALKIPNINYYGVGETVNLFDNSLPEGRFYSRTVQIIVETPIDWKNQ